LGFGGSCGTVFVCELAAVLVIGGWIFGGKDGGAGSESMSEGVERRTLFAGFGARSGGVMRVRAIADGDALGLSGCRWGHWNVTWHWDITVVGGLGGGSWRLLRGKR
jgi:hypothetical protein